VPKKPPVLQLPTTVAEEIADIARRAQRSVAFVAVRAVAAAKDAPPPQKIAGPTAPLSLATDDEDPPNLLKQPPSAESVAAAWPIAREKFLAWVRRLEEASQAERADDLDAALAEAAHPQTAAARLAELSRSEYPKVRALVAAHTNTSAEVREKLKQDRERSVRESAGA
jgi:hypothetical protein